MGIAKAMQIDQQEIAFCPSPLSFYIMHVFSVTGLAENINEKQAYISRTFSNRSSESVDR